MICYLRRPLLVILLVMLPFDLASPGTGAESASRLPKVRARLALLDSLPVCESPQLAADIKQPVLAYLIDQLDHRFSGVLTSEHLAQAILTSNQSSRFSSTILSEIRRLPAAQKHRAWSLLALPGPSRISIPYSFLGYHPGSVVCTAELLLEEYYERRMNIVDAYGITNQTITIENVTFWCVLEGELYLDVDGWLDHLLGSKIDDTRIIGGVLFTYQNIRYALAMGYNNHGRGQYGAIDLHDDKLHSSTPEVLPVIARNMRLRVSRRVKSLGYHPWWEDLKK